MAASLLQTSTLLRTEGSGATSNHSYTSNLAAGSLSLVFVGNFPSGMASVVGTSGAYTKAVGYSDGGDNWCEIWYRANVGGGAETVTFTPTSTSGNYLTCVMQEWGGMVTASALDQIGSAGALTVSTAGATTQASEVAFTISVADQGTANVGWGTPSLYTLIARENDSNTYTGMQAAYRLLIATGTQTATHTSSGIPGDSVIATFKVQTGGGSVTLSPPLLAGTGALYSPSISATAVTITAPLLAGTGVLYAPGVYVDAQLTAPLIGSTGALYAPTLSATAVPLSPPRLNSTGALYAPSISATAVTLSPPLLASTGALYVPTVTQSAAGAVTLSPPLLASTGTLYSPSLSVAAVTLTAPLLASTGQTYAPSLTLGAIGLTAPLLNSTGALYAPGVYVDAQLAAPLLAGTGALYAPTIQQSTPGAVTLYPQPLASTGSLFEPAIGVGQILLTAPLITSTGALYSPALTQATQLAAPLLNSTGALYPPLIVPGEIIVRPGLIASTGALYAPTVTGGADTPLPTDRVYLVAAELRRFDVIDGPRVWEVSAENRRYEVRDE
jgi:hypothetical protein